jgi:hypothetical protein
MEVLFGICIYENQNFALKTKNNPQFFRMKSAMGQQRKPRKAVHLGQQGNGGWSHSGRPRMPKRPLMNCRGVAANGPVPPAASVFLAKECRGPSALGQQGAGALKIKWNTRFLLREF